MAGRSWMVPGRRVVPRRRLRPRRLGPRRPRLGGRRRYVGHRLRPHAAGERAAGLSCLPQVVGLRGHTQLQGRGRGGDRQPNLDHLGDCGSRDWNIEAPTTEGQVITEPDEARGHGTVVNEPVLGDRVAGTEPLSSCSSRSFMSFPGYRPTVEVIDGPLSPTSHYYEIMGRAAEIAQAWGSPVGGAEHRVAGDDPQPGNGPRPRTCGPSRS